MTNHMKALVKARAEEGLWMERVPVPEPGPQEVLIKVRKSAICGTVFISGNGMNGPRRLYLCPWW